MQKTNFKSGFVAILGRPNAGKSTLLNCLLGEKIAIISPKPQTTRNKILGIVQESNFQAIFIDTPGLHTPKSKLGEFMVKSAESAVRDVDCILFLVTANPNAPMHSSDLAIANGLLNKGIPVILVINKVDLIPTPEILLEIEKNKDMGFNEIVPISALKSENTRELLATVNKYLPEGPKYFPEDMITDQPERQIAAEIIREKALTLLQDEIPHGIAVSIDSFKKRDNKNLVDIQANIFCEKETHKGIIIGKKGEMLRKIGSYARSDMERIFGTPINLQIWIKVKKDWRDSDFLVKNFGYDTKNLSN